jgi:heptosyltransferase-2
MSSGTALIVRFSSLGDVLLAAHVPVYLRRVRPGRRVLFLTKERYGGVLRGHPDVDRFYLLEDGSSGPAEPAPLGVRAGLGDLIAFLKREGVEEVIDLHQNLRSSRVVSAFDRARKTLPPKHSFRRRLMVHAKWLKPEPLPPLLRTYRAAAGLDPTDAEPTPWLRSALTDTELARARASLGGDADGFILFGAGARWATKRWPAGHFAALAEAVEREFGLASRFALAPDETAIADELRALLPKPRWETIVVRGFRETAAIASFARAIVSNDSAVLHLGAALDVPVVALFGSTIPAFGFAPEAPRNAVGEISLGCRPCDVHGKRRCPLGHHNCMVRLTPEITLSPLRRVLDGLDARGRLGAGTPS